MSNSAKLATAFADALEIEAATVSDELQYNRIPEWDSVAHMTLIAELEKVFNVMFDTDQIIDMSSVARAKEILAQHGVEF
jgi:acyl carrier protein